MTSDLVRFSSSSRSYHGSSPNKEQSYVGEYNNYSACKAEKPVSTMAGIDLVINWHHFKIYDQCHRQVLTEHFCGAEDDYDFTFLPPFILSCFNNLAKPMHRSIMQLLCFRQLQTIAVDLFSPRLHN